MALFEPMTSRREASGQAIWFALWLAVTGFAIYLTPSPSGHGTHEELGLPPCPSVLLFDRPCPGCGLTTSWTAFVHGDWSLAFHAHPLGPVLYVGFSIFAIAGFVGYLRGLRFDTDTQFANKAMSWLMIGFIAFGLVRMIFSPKFGTPQERLVAHAVHL